MEIWKPLRKYPNYNGSTEGRVMNVRTQRILTPHKDLKGRMTVSLRNNGKQHTVKVRRVIAETFLGEHPGMDARNKNGDQTNNSIDNLEWCNRSDTISSAYERGSKAPSKQTGVRVIETGKYYNSLRECARDIGCSHTAICDYLAGKVTHVRGYHFVKVD